MRLNDYWSIQNHPKSGVTTVMRAKGKPGRVLPDGEEIAYCRDPMMAYHIANAMQAAAEGERAAELMIPEGPERAAAMKTRKYAVD